MQPTLAASAVSAVFATLPSPRPASPASPASPFLATPVLAPPSPVHTVYGGAHLFRADVAAKMGKLALGALAAYAGDDEAFGRVFGLEGALAPPVVADVRRRVLAKLQREPVEDLRIDFEDGFGVRSDAEEDEAALAAAREVAHGMTQGTLPRGLGIRVKSLAPDTRARAARTLDLFLSALASASPRLPEAFCVTLPKVTSPAEVSALGTLVSTLEGALTLPSGSLRLEIMVETPQCLVGPTGASLLPAMADAGGERLVAAHFGTYDLASSLDVAAPEQGPDHPSAVVGRVLMQMALAGRGLSLSDGATAVLPVGGAAEIVAAWSLHAKNVRSALALGLYRGWDLHPSQLPARFAATYGFFLGAAPAMGKRLKTFLGRAAQASRVGVAFDDAATALGLLAFFRKALECGALSEDEVTAHTGLDRRALQARTFAPAPVG